MRRIMLVCLLFIIAMFIFSVSLLIISQIDVNKKSNIVSSISQNDKPAQASDDDSTEISEILTEGDPKAATYLQTEVGCSEIEDDKITAILSWSVAWTLGTEQRVAVTDSRHGFSRGNFMVSGLLSPKQNYLEWDLASGDITNYWRVLTKHEDGWVASDTSNFQGLKCD